MPKVSVIIPIYNVEKYLRQCLNSVINQTLSDIEIICINDCSPDNSLSILQEYAQNDNRIKIIDLKENGGPGNARNIAIDSAQGDYIMFLDPDDWYELNACETAYNQIAKNGNDLCLFGYNLINEIKGTKSYFRNMIEPYESQLNNPNIKLQEIDKNFLISMFTVMYIYNKDYLNKNHIKYSNHKFCEDTIFGVRSLLLNNSFSIIDSPLYNYRIHKNSTNSTRSDLWGHLLSAKDQVLDWINDNKPEFLKHYLSYYISSTLYFYKNLTKKNKSIEYDFYIRLQQIFKDINQKYNIADCKDFIYESDYNDFYEVINNSFSKYKFNQIKNTVFSIKKYRKHKVITILGLKIKTKLKGNDDE